MRRIYSDTIQINIHDLFIIKLGNSKEGKNYNKYVPMMKLSTFENGKSTPSEIFYTSNLTTNKDLFFYNKLQIESLLFVDVWQWIQEQLNKGIRVVCTDALPVTYASMSQGGLILEKNDAFSLGREACGRVYTFSEIWESSGLDFDLIHQKKSTVYYEHFIEKRDSLLKLVDKLQDLGSDILDIQNVPTGEGDFISKRSYEHKRVSKDSFYVLSLTNSLEKVKTYSTYFGGYRLDADGRITLSLVDTIDECCHFPDEDIAIRFMMEHEEQLKHFMFDVVEIKEREVIRLRHWF